MSNDVLFESSEEYKGFTITFQALIEDISPGDSCDPDFCADTIKAIHNGEIMWFCAKVTANLDGLELGYDILACCAYEKYEDFTAEPDGYYADMRETVVEEAITQLEELCKKLPELKRITAT